MTLIELFETWWEKARFRPVTEHVKEIAKFSFEAGYKAGLNAESDTTLTINQAEFKIAKILKQLEIENDSLVEQLNIVNIDVTNIDDERQQLVTSIRIKLKRNPGRRWSVK